MASERRCCFAEIAPGGARFQFQSVENSSSNQVTVKGDRPNGVIIAGYRVCDAVRIGIAVNNSDDRNPEAFCLRLWRSIPCSYR